MAREYCLIIPVVGSMHTCDNRCTVHGVMLQYSNTVDVGTPTV